MADQQELSGFMSNMDVFLREKLSVLIPSLDLLEKRLKELPEDDGKVAECLDMARRSAFSILRTAWNLGDYSKYIANYDLAEPSLIDLARLCEDIIYEANLLTANGGKKTQFICAERPFVAFVDAAKMERLLYNLISNAICSGGDTVTVALERSDGSIILRVRSNGGKIGDDVLPHLYEGYKTFELRSKKGLGLGLPLALAIVCQSGGTLIATSDAHNGSTVTASLPDRPAEDEVITEVSRVVKTGGHAPVFIELADLPAHSTLPFTKKNQDYIGKQVNEHKISRDGAL